MTNSQKNKAEKMLIANWNALVREGEFTREEMTDSLTDQINADGQGWDMSLEELDSQPELMEIMGYDEDGLTDEQADEWLTVVQDAARKWLDKHNKK